VCRLACRLKRNQVERRSCKKKGEDTVSPREKEEIKRETEILEEKVATPNQGGYHKQHRKVVF